jgi:hypothetical protein
MIAKSSAVAQRTAPRVGIPHTPQSAGNASRRTQSPGGSGRNCPSRASRHAGQAHECCRSGQQANRHARVLILPACHFPIVHRIYRSISNFIGVVKFWLAAALKSGERPTLRARIPSAHQARPRFCVLAMGQVRRSPRAEDRLKGGEDSARHPPGVRWIPLCHSLVSPCRLLGGTETERELGTLEAAVPGEFRSRQT